MQTKSEQTKSDKHFWVRTNKVSDQFIPATLSGGFYYIAGSDYPYIDSQLVEIGPEIIWQKEVELKKTELKKTDFKNTVGYWIEKIVDKKVRKKALANLWPKSANQLAYSTFQALGMAFCWSDSPEGADFWIQVRDKYGKEEEKED
jgi:hypothetical protein